MAFVPISIDNYIKKHLQNNPSEKEVDLRKRINQALADYQKGVKCSCGNDIWVVGSAALGNGCFTCITGESRPTGEYEISEAIKKRENRKGRRHIDEMDKTKIAGFFTDEGYLIEPAELKSVPIPGLCLICRKYDIYDPEDENLLCDMNRWDQRDEAEFKCGAFEGKRQ